MLLDESKTLTTLSGTCVTIQQISFIENIIYEFGYILFYYRLTICSI